MAKSSPEKLAAALRANLLRRKKGAPAKAPAGPSDGGALRPDKPPKKSA